MENQRQAESVLYWEKKLVEGRLKCGEKSVKSLRYQIQTLEHSRAHYYSVE